MMVYHLSGLTCHGDAFELHWSYLSPGVTCLQDFFIHCYEWIFFLYVFVYVAPKWIKMFVLDEADEMLSRGFKDQIYEIFQKLSTNIQVSLCPPSRDKKSCGGAWHKVHSCLVLVRRFGVRSPFFPSVSSFHPKELCLNYRLQVSWFM